MGLTFKEADSSTLDQSSHLGSHPESPRTGIDNHNRLLCLGESRSDLCHDVLGHLVRRCGGGALGGYG